MTNSPNDTKHPRILLATGNPAKQETLRWLLEGLPLTPVAPAELGLSPDVDETGDTHEEIARRKAADWSRAAGMTVIASDGGWSFPPWAPTGKAATPTASPAPLPTMRNAPAACWN